MLWGSFATRGYSYYFIYTTKRNNARKFIDQCIQRTSIYARDLIQIQECVLTLDLHVWGCLIVSQTIRLSKSQYCPLWLAAVGLVCHPLSASARNMGNNSTDLSNSGSDPASFLAWSQPWQLCPGASLGPQELPDTAAPTANKVRQGRAEREMGQYWQEREGEGRGEIVREGEGER